MLQTTFTTSVKIKIWDACGTNTKNDPNAITAQEQ